MPRINHTAAENTPNWKELCIYRKCVSTLVEEAEAKFIIGQLQGYQGWAEMDLVEIRQAISRELSELDAAWRVGSMMGVIEEAADVLNFSVFAAKSFDSSFDSILKRNSHAQAKD